MTLPVSFPASGIAGADVTSRPAAAKQTNSSDIGQRFEQMLWTEMLTYAGLDKAFSQGGGEAASSFSRYIVEAVAKDLAESHPMGLGDAVDRSMALRQAQNKDNAS